jgi:hypothetical protein
MTDAPPPPIPEERVKIQYTPPEKLEQTEVALPAAPEQTEGLSLR